MEETWKHMGKTEHAQPTHLPRTANSLALPAQARYNDAMSVQEIETAVSALPPSQLAEFLQWLQEFQADAWDRQIAEDAQTGRLDPLIARAKQQVQAGQYRQLGPDTPLTP